MSHLTIGITTISCYLAAIILISLSMHQSNNTARHAAAFRKLTTLCTVIALIFHAIFLQQLIITSVGVNFAFFNSLTLFAWLITVLLMIISSKYPISKISLLLLPVTIITIILSLSFPVDSHPMQTLSPQMITHIILSILAYGVLSLAALQAILLAIQDSQLHRHTSTHFTQSLPPIQSMEKILFRILNMGFVLLTTALISGFLFTEDYFSHKIIFSIFAWLVFGSLLLGRWLAGWRGRKAINWTLVGISALLLGYFGSKLVLELVLNR